MSYLVLTLGDFVLGDIIIGDFVLWDFVQKCFCPRGLFPRGFRPRGFCPRFFKLVVTTLDQNDENGFANNLVTKQLTKTRSQIVSH